MVGALPGPGIVWQEFLCLAGDQLRWRLPTELAPCDRQNQELAGLPDRVLGLSATLAAFRDTAARVKARVAYLLAGLRLCRTGDPDE